MSHEETAVKVSKALQKDQMMKLAEMIVSYSIEQKVSVTRTILQVEKWLEQKRTPDEITKELKGESA